MWFGVLGPLEVRADRVVGEVPAARQRVLLAALVLRAGHVVPMDELSEVVWDGAPPASARTTLKSYVMRLRRVLGPQAGGRIVTRYPGYLLEAGDDEVDALAFARLCRQGRAAGRAGCWERASGLLGDGLALWRGVPLADVPSEALQREQVARLERLHVQALEWRIEADLHLGRHGEVAGELQALAAEHPLRERLYELLMLALYRDGRQAEALAAYRRVRDVLVDELGVEPGPQLRELHHQVLAGDPELAAAGMPDGPGADGPAGPAGGLPARMAGMVPRQLPAAVAHFAGRAAELEVLAGLADKSAEAVVISAVCGTAGVGKTALAVYWAHRVADRFGDGQLYVNLRGFGPSGPPLTPGEAVRGFLDALQVPTERIPAEPQAQAGLYRSLLAGRRMLIVLDNARDADQVRPLLPGSPGCLVLITSRNRLTGLAATHAAVPITVNLLTDEEAAELLARRLGAERVAAEQDAVRELTGLCARLPLALSVAAARAAVRPGFPLAELVTELRDAGGRLDALDAGEETSSARAVFSWSYQELDAPAARMFRLLGLHPGPGFTASAAASLAGVPPGEAGQALAALTQVHLLAEHVPGRFEFHDLLRAYAAERACAQEDQAGRCQAAGRILDYYLHTAQAADRLLYPHRQRLTLGQPLPGVVPGQLGDSDQALTWFDAEHRTLVAAIGQAASQGFGTRAWQLAWTMESFFHRGGHSRDWIATQQIALAAAQHAGDTAGQAHACRGIGTASFALGLYRDAHIYAARALDLYRQLDDGAGRGNAHLDIARACEREGRWHDGIRHVQRALQLFRAEDCRTRETAALNHLGWFYAHLGDYQQALATCQRALDTMLKAGDRHNAAPTWDSLGYAHQHLGHHAEAAACYHRSLELYEELGFGEGKARTLANLGDAQQATGKFRAARDAWQQALALLDDLHHPDAAQVRAKLRALDAVLVSAPGVCPP